MATSPTEGRPNSSDDEAARRYHLSQAILAAALQVAEHDRSAFVKRACGDHDDVRVRVMAMIEAFGPEEGDDDASIDTPSGDLTLPTVAVDPSVDPLIGLDVGPYRLLGRLGVGQGGMADVYIARRVADYDQTVAVKVARWDIMWARETERFRQERQILASLEHPNIARLIDGGTLPDGRPFLVMEYIDGASICEYAERQRLPLPERLRLFAGVCRAVRYAHQQLIIHRDLKPANILVDTKGEPKLLDFGIAKLLTLGGRDAAPLTCATHTGSERVFAPRTDSYASPEQLRGERVGTTSDVYSLGIVLYELLTARRPFAASHHKVRGHTNLPIRPPSDEANDSGAGPAGGVLPSLLRGDVDAVVLKALQWDPAARYASVDALCDDIERILAGDIVSPRRSDRMYVLTRRVVQHRRIAWSLALCIVGLLAGAAGLYRAWQVTRESVDAAERVEAQAYQAVKDLIRVVVVTGQGASQGASVERLRASAGPYLRDRAARSGGAASQTGVIGDLNALAQLQAQLGDRDGAARTLAIRADLLKRASAQNPRDAEAAKRYVEALFDLAAAEQRLAESARAERALRAAADTAGAYQRADPRRADVFGALEARAQRRLDQLAQRGIDRLISPSDRHKSP